ncbi:MAG: protoporphyrinogen oxidase [Acidimicrobiaceae bacterium]|nr:protoporphyrinogen oxidase [Acidimicrobiaceae bacterium]
MADRRALVVGAGITGLTAALDLTADFDHVEVREAADRVGGKLQASPFAGIDRVDEGADAYLLRVPDAGDLAARVGLTDIVSPTSASASVWHDGLHDIPGGLVLGMPAAIRPFATSSLLSWRGKVRAAIEPLLPGRDHGDSLGALVRYRFGDEVHERLVDALVGSIYAADTDRWSLQAVPQLAALSTGHRSLLVAARRRPAPPAPGGPIFGAPETSMGSLAIATADEAQRRGVVVRTSTSVHSIERADTGRSGGQWRVDDDAFDAVILACPAAVSSRLLDSCAPTSARSLARIDTADVVMVRLLVADWPDRLHGRSGYLVPKPDQHLVTAASFASQKWAHWQPSDGQMLRVSLGRDGLPVMHLSDDDVTRAVVDEVGRHLDLDLQPTELSITRWGGAFPQYRPHHHELVATARSGLPPGLAIAGASYDGIGVPACVASGRTAAAAVKQSTSLADGSLT